VHGDEEEMRIGSLVKVPDGRIGTVVYNGLDGVGIKWGEHRLGEEDLEQICGLCPLFDQKVPSGYKWFPEAIGVAAGVEE
jgi:hypothetical protein